MLRPYLVLSAGLSVFFSTCVAVFFHALYYFRNALSDELAKSVQAILLLLILMPTGWLLDKIQIFFERLVSWLVNG